MSQEKSYTWNGLDWAKIQSIVRKIQYRIYDASSQGNLAKVHRLQKFLINFMPAKLIAVRQVTTLNKGRNTPGIDKQVFVDPQEKLKLAKSLKLDGQAKPIRRVWIPKPGKSEKRPLGIPIIEDRAKQALAKLALEPEWEAIFEPNSYGFRPGRSAMDSIEAIFLNLRHNRPKWVYDADIQKCFDRINHDSLLTKLNTFPLMQNQVKAWLKAGVMEGYANLAKPSEILQTSTGTPQGGIISPLLANIALHGLENHLSEYVANLPMQPHPGSNRGKAAKVKALSVIRYADDFLIIHSNKEILELCIQETHRWLSRMGLTISEEKSALRDAREGFQFLGFQIIMVMKPKAKKYKVKIQPSKANQLKLLKKVKDIIANNKAVSSYDLIMMLRPVILGWANYFKYSECKDVFYKLTNSIFQKIRAWVFRRDTRNGRMKVREKYFPIGQTYQFDGSKHMDNWILVGSKKLKNGIIRQTYLPHIVWVKSRKHVKVKGNASPYSGDLYWALRSSKYSPYPLRIRTLLVKQKQRCTICNQIFIESDSQNWEVDHIIPRSKGGLDIYNNLQLVHKHCHLAKTKTEIFN
jgi:RNA-directed DNA polymerase